MIRIALTLALGLAAVPAAAQTPATPTPAAPSVTAPAAPAPTTAQPAVRRPMPRPPTAASAGTPAPVNPDVQNRVTEADARIARRDRQMRTMMRSICTGC